jgi:PPM family protein phosphatase
MLHLVDELMPIGEFSERSGLSQKRLRSYAAEGLLVPAAVDPASGYRYYSPGQMHDAQVIDALRQAGLSLADIRVGLSRPSANFFEAWERQLDSDALRRQEALERARSLLAAQGTTRAETAKRNTTGGMMTRLRSAGRSETGPVRENNEDAVVSGDRLAVVADGMGGHPGGEVAANAATALVLAVFTGRSIDELEAAVRAANWAIWDRARGQSELAGMGTTICAAGILDNGRLALVHVGDSRAYLWHDGELGQLTEDHTVTADLVRRGELADEDASQHPHYGILTRALGVAPKVEIDSATYSVAVGDRLVFCSDGLFNEVTQAEIADAVAADKDGTSLADDLVELALARGGRDNVSVVVAEVAA